MICVLPNALKHHLPDIKIVYDWELRKYWWQDLSSYDLDLWLACCHHVLVKLIEEVWTVQILYSENIHVFVIDNQICPDISDTTSTTPLPEVTSATLKAYLGVLPVIVILGLREYSQNCYTMFVGVLPQKWSKKVLGVLSYLQSCFSDHSCGSTPTKMV